MAEPRNFWAQPTANRHTGEWLAETLSAFGYRVQTQGGYRNVVAIPPRASDRPRLLVCAHYDSVPGTPGADDNASGVAVLLWCAAQLAMHTHADVGFVAFNAEEDGLAGSKDFVDWLRTERPFPVAGAHVLEMVGYCARGPGSQRVPSGVPLKAPDRGDFIGLLGNSDSRELLSAAVGAARTGWAGVPVVSMMAPWGIDRWFPVLHRSDHSPFWKHRIPALLWTDTAEFRNPNYHRESDTPDTLDYSFMAGVAELVISSVRQPRKR